MRMLLDQQIEDIGKWSDTLDNLLAAATLPIPESIAGPARTASLESLRDEIRAFIVELTGQNPWE